MALMGKASGANYIFSIFGFWDAIRPNDGCRITAEN
jgi:hypothetical protein